MGWVVWSGIEIKRVCRWVNLSWRGLVCLSLGGFVVARVCRE